MARRLAAIDCGTNSTRLLVAEVGDPGPQGGSRVTTLARRMHITRLGRGVDASGRLAADAIERTVAVLRGYGAVLEELDVSGVRITATSAARDAANREELFDAAEAAVGTRPELLSGLDEGRLSFAGATAVLDPGEGPFLVVDIGGGSTEFVVGTSEAEGVVSVDVGCVRLTEQYLHSDPPAPEELSTALSLVAAHLDDVTRQLPATRTAARFVGLAGTVTTVAAVEIGLAAYDRDAIHHFELTHAAAEDVFRTLATEARAERVHNPGLEEARADVIVGGTCVLVAVMRYFGFDRCLVSEADILDGLVLSQLDGGASLPG